MIENSQLIYLKSVLLPDSPNNNIETIQKFIAEDIDSRLSATIMQDKVSIRDVEDPCVVIYHPDHENDYYKYVVLLEKSLKIPTLVFYKLGVSKNKEADIDAVKGGVYRTIVRGFVRNSMEFEAEQQWYHVVERTLYHLARAFDS